MKFLLPSLFIFLLFIARAHAASPGDVVINEIAWMGTTNYHGDEWMELYNNTEGPISLEGWVLGSTDGKPNISLGGVVSSGDFFLLERTDDTSVSDKQADQIYTGVLGNSGEHLELLDAQGNLIDNVNAWGKVLWEGFGGDNETKHTMERKDPKRKIAHILFKIALSRIPRPLLHYHLRQRLRRNQPQPQPRKAPHLRQTGRMADRPRGKPSLPRAHS